jgi:uncharacterized protein YjiS (DUF1127 family)
MNTQCLDTRDIAIVAPGQAPATSVMTPFKSVIARMLNAVATYLERRKQYRTDRDAFDSMLDLSDDILDDIGITRDDIVWASTLPKSVNASKALEDARRHGRL